ncbi:nudix hydrolase 15, mitochondrial [Arabidopsis lyrata subsp. lyrata]|uniref:nudix hydrolase 15, mitochondrial n=1 Tax=Arabidopsis lyrata subsp. lyrata TaxID=81972 RepID=UPI000A29C70C|nr:nudix hydrolase 15, mitochondrial [Arabidopsis lyrata subsp. lyrata]|eukprot:XP_020883569.1 nudix hydrolase 15, mitochondrial [Arabidopsis lyrata subsp. lyrata]
MASTNFLGTLARADGLPYGRDFDTHQPTDKSGYSDEEEIEGDAGRTCCTAGDESKSRKINGRCSRGGRDACIQGEHQQIDLSRWFSGTYGSGEISLPGGKAEENDKDDGITATREAEEEIGLDPSLVDVVAFLEPFLSQHLLRVIPVIGILWDRKAFNPTPSPAECTITADKGNPFGLGRLRETVNNRKRKESCASSSSSLSEMQEQFQAARRKLAEQDLINSQREAEQRIAQSRFSSLEMIVSYLKTNDPQFADFLARQPPIIPPETDQPLDKALYQPLDRALHQPLHKALHQPLHKALHQPKDIPCCSSLSFVQPGN